MFPPIKSLENSLSQDVAHFLTKLTAREIKIMAIAVVILVAIGQLAYWIWRSNWPKANPEELKPLKMDEKNPSPVIDRQAEKELISPIATKLLSEPEQPKGSPKAEMEEIAHLLKLPLVVQEEVVVPLQKDSDPHQLPESSPTPAKGVSIPALKVDLIEKKEIVDPIKNEPDPNTGILEGNAIEETVKAVEVPPLPPIDYKALFLQVESKTKRVAMLPYSYANCRFPDILCPFETAVKKPETPHEIYLHANRINLADLKVIGTQYPLPLQIPLFWKLCQEASLIVDLTNDKDIKKGLVPYYPLTLGEEKIYGDVKVVCKSKTIFKDLSLPIYTYQVIQIVDGKEVSFEVSRLNYEGWDDYQGTPEDDLDQIITALAHFTQKSSHPPVIHCRAGVGRTGTITVANAFQSLVNQGKVTPTNFLEILCDLTLEGRDQRSFAFVQNDQQFLTLIKWSWRALHRGPRQFKPLECTV